ncbi:MAG: biotin/lipoyl-binding protein, partial [Rubrivivax sp.]
MLTAPSTVTVRSKVGGTLQSLSVQEGSRVRMGQVIGRVDAAEAASRVAERTAMVESARTSRELRPLMSTRATPSTRCRRLPTSCSPITESSRALR